MILDSIDKAIFLPKVTTCLLPCYIQRGEKESVSNWHLVILFNVVYKV
jgi:hypothetical protein